MWPKPIENVPRILEAADVLIAGSSDNDLVPPIANVDEVICFNGVVNDALETFYLSQWVQDHSVNTIQGTTRTTSYNPI